MNVQITITLDVGEQDSTKDAIESAKNQLRSMSFEDALELFEFATLGSKID